MSTFSTLQDYVFTFKANNGSKYGDFDHVLVKYLWSYDNPDEWGVYPVGKDIRTPAGSLPKDELALKHVLENVINLGTHTLRKKLFGDYNHKDVERLVEMATTKLTQRKTRPFQTGGGYVEVF